MTKQGPSRKVQNETNLAMSTSLISIGVFPVELYGTIAENVDRVDLLRLVTVSRGFQIEAERLLHRQVPHKWRSSHELDRFCERILGLPRFWPLIIHLSLAFLPEDRINDEQDGTRSRLTAVFQKLKNLTVLEFFGYLDPGPEPMACGHFFKGSDFQLRSLSCQFPLDKHFSDFLQSQPRLLHFGWFSKWEPSVDFPQNALPVLGSLKLEHFATTHSRIAPFIASGRPITHFSTSQAYCDISILQSLDLCAMPLQALEMIPSPGILQPLPKLFPKLEYLAMAICASDVESNSGFLTSLLIFDELGNSLHNALASNVQAPPTSGISHSRRW
jgi:hypothetical protein